MMDNYLSGKTGQGWRRDPECPVNQAFIIRGHYGAVTVSYAPLKKVLPVLFIVCFCLPGLAGAAELRGRVIEIRDGDSFVLLHKGRTVEVRLFGIDAPEWNQPYGDKARSFLRRKAYQARVTIQVITWDRYNRAIARVILPSGQNLAHELVRAGMAWWYRRYAPQDHVLARLEAEARKEKRGLWRQPNPEPPWNFRHRQ